LTKLPTRWTKRDAGSLALAWLCIFGLIVLVLVVLPDPPGPGDQARLPSVLLDYLFGAIAVAVGVGIACVFWTISLVRRVDRELEEKLERLEQRLDADRDPTNKPGTLKP
jgi:hypothetical protein